ncbi:PREDICTED: BAHD acyltransferase At5g47980-like [Fragaria vesca subsp. vesca]|uniref:BAHD acyltransferase At5g47980-like n=1 Tax=Fragaria vesca subsp. vesca TaxID=101020 RepID=UPI0002C32F16|nr:PREDICTED: BAHD acyltransferase At5g47980-like [Fragaria vesca subsp. vesca]
MEKIEVSIISKHTIKPSASSTPLQPYNLTLLDQLTPPAYVPMVFFYPITDHVFNLPQTLADLRQALSETLTLYYPLSGRVKNNLYIDDFEEGVPYLEARVNCDMTDFLRLRKIECLNEFVPIKPFSMEAISDERYPLLGVQVNILDSGIAICVFISHKLIDGRTADCFLKSWGAIFRGCREDIIHPSLSEAALLFPPRDDLPEKYAGQMERVWFAGKKVATRRFVFGAKAISSIQDEAKSEPVPKPSRVQAVTGFLWKHLIAASRALTLGTTSTRLSIAAQAVNLRTRINMETVLDNAIGNLMWWAQAILELCHTTPEISDLKLCDLVNLLNGSVKQCNSDYFETFKGKEGYGRMCEYLDFQRTMSSMEPSREIYLFSSWTNFFNALDFGWGRTSWIGVAGKIESAFCNLTILVPTPCNTGIEAWVNLEEEKMAMLEQDPQFLALASPKTLISRN